jgi:hypothetical protein
MCECLRHSDGTITLCEVCTDAWDEAQSDMQRIHDEVERQRDRAGMHYEANCRLGAENARLAARNRLLEAVRKVAIWWQEAMRRGEPTASHYVALDMALAACAAPVCETCVSPDLAGIDGAGCRTAPKEEP